MNDSKRNAILIRQNDVMISLLARTALGTEVVRSIITRGKRDPEAYVKVYNALDGTIAVMDCAKLAGVTAGTISVILRNWEEQGIIYDVGGKNKPLYKRLLALPPKEA